MKKAFGLPTTEKCTYTENVLSTSGVLDPSDIVCELGFGSLALRKMAPPSKFYLNFILVVLFTQKKIASGDYIGYFAKLGLFITRQVL